MMKGAQFKFCCSFVFAGTKNNGVIGEILAENGA